MPAKKATPKAKTSTWSSKKEPKILSSTEAKMVFSSVAEAFIEHYVNKHAKLFTKKAIKTFGSDLLNVFDNMEIESVAKGPVVVTAAHKSDDKPEET